MPLNDSKPGAGAKPRLTKKTQIEKLEPPLGSSSLRDKSQSLASLLLNHLPCLRRFDLMLATSLPDSRYVLAI